MTDTQITNREIEEGWKEKRKKREESELGKLIEKMKEYNREGNGVRDKKG